MASLFVVSLDSRVTHHRLDSMRIQQTGDARALTRIFRDSGARTVVAVNEYLADDGNVITTSDYANGTPDTRIYVDKYLRTHGGSLVQRTCRATDSIGPKDRDSWNAGYCTFHILKRFPKGSK